MGVDKVQIPAAVFPLNSTASFNLAMGSISVSEALAVNPNNKKAKTKLNILFFMVKS
jgi:hypothetical protein